MTDVTVDTLRLRGPRAHRLATVAAGALPAALERALGDVADVQLDTVEVVLDLDPEEYDDQTLAVLWADAIRTEVLAAGGRTRQRPRAAAHQRHDGHLEDSRACAAAARAWLATSKGEHDRADRLPAPLLALADPATADQVAALLGAGPWQELLRRLRGHLDQHVVPPGPRGVRADVTPDDPPPPMARPLLPQPDRTSNFPPASATRQPSGPTTDRPHSGSKAADTVLGDLRALADLAGVGRSVELAALTRAAGLVLLYPWLADHCRQAETLHPGLDPVAVREAALATLVDPEDPALLDDPLVRLLSGDPGTARDGPRTRVAMHRHHDVAQAADRVLSSFASLLPGFGRSTPAFVRTSWIARPGLLDEDHSPTLLTAHTQPLDVVLPRLPYPLGLVKLPWSPPLSVRFRP